MRRLFEWDDPDEIWDAIRDEKFILNAINKVCDEVCRVRVQAGARREDTAFEALSYFFGRNAGGDAMTNRLFLSLKSRHIQTTDKGRDDDGDSFVRSIVQRPPPHESQETLREIMRRLQLTATVEEAKETSMEPTDEDIEDGNESGGTEEKEVDDRPRKRQKHNEVDLQYLFVSAASDY